MRLKQPRGSEKKNCGPNERRKNCVCVCARFSISDGPFGNLYHGLILINHNKLSPTKNEQFKQQ